MAVPHPPPCSTRSSPCSSRTTPICLEQHRRAPDRSPPVTVKSSRGVADTLVRKGRGQGADAPAERRSQTLSRTLRRHQAPSVTVSPPPRPATVRGHVTWNGPGAGRKPRGNRPAVPGSTASSEDAPRAPHTAPDEETACEHQGQEAHRHRHRAGPARDLRLRRRRRASVPRAVRLRGQPRRRALARGAGGAVAANRPTLDHCRQPERLRAPRRGWRGRVAGSRSAGAAERTPCGGNGRFPAGGHARATWS